MIEFPENPIPNGLKKGVAVGVGEGRLAPRFLHLYSISKHPQSMQISPEGWKFASERDANKVQ